MGHLGRLSEADAALRAARLDAATAGAVAMTLQALAAPSRLLILASLRHRPNSVGDLAASVGMEPSAVSHQLRLLRNLRLVVGTRTGKSIVYSLHDGHVAALLDEALYHVEHLRLGTADETRDEDARAGALSA
jgi:ArsR family transcriptional regulator, nickel/cobalt-responsive transcriptional repressor